MSQTTSSDILMKFVLNGTPIPGESTAAITAPGKTPHKLLHGFRRGGMLEIDSFTFSLGVQDPNTSSTITPTQPGSTQPGTQPGMPPGTQPGMPPGGWPPGQGPTGGRPGPYPAGKSTLGQFQGWRSGRGNQTKYPVSVQPISFTRSIDRASTELLHYCIKSISFDSASLVKRKAAGGGIAGEPYLRLDFTGVLITDVSWTNDDPVKETCKFISRAITVQYRPQLPDGTLGAVRHGFWSMNPSEREVIL
jgi:type VI protein secretion system component Hcp